MNRFQKFAAIAFISSCSCLSAADSIWTTDFSAAKSRAIAEEKDLLLDFTGSDWCTWCIKLHKEVFDQTAFIDAAPKSYVLVELDYPKDMSGQSEALRKQNEELKNTYPIAASPTVLLCDSTGKPYGMIGYIPGGPEAFLPEMEKLQAQKQARDEAFAKAESMQGLDRAQQLISGLEALHLTPAMIAATYPEIAAGIVEADPEDVTGFAAAAKQEEQLQDFLRNLGELRSKGDPDATMKFIDDKLADPSTKGELRQQVYGHKAGTLAYAGKKQEAIKVLQTAIAEAPDGSRTQELKDFIGILEKEAAAPQTKE